METSTRRHANRGQPRTARHTKYPQSQMNQSHITHARQPGLSPLESVDVHVPLGIKADPPPYQWSALRPPCSARLPRFRVTNRVAAAGASRRPSEPNQTSLKPVPRPSGPRTQDGDKGIMRALVPTYSGQLQAAGVTPPASPAAFSTPGRRHFASRMVSRDLSNALASASSPLVRPARRKALGASVATGSRTWSKEVSASPSHLSAATKKCPETATKLPAGGHENCPLTVMGSARHDVVYLAASRGWGPSPGALGGAEAPALPRRG
jgi:hypothetical protein